MTGMFLGDPRLAKAVSNLVPRSERQPDPQVLLETYVETGVKPQVSNQQNQILYGRRGTGKSHVLQVLASDFRAQPDTSALYIDLRVLGSAHLFTDETRAPADRCVAVFKDLLSVIQGELLDLATDPGRDRGGLEEVSHFADFITRKAAEVNSRDVKNVAAAGTNRNLHVGLGMSPAGPSAQVGSSMGDSASVSQEIAYTEALRETIVFSEIHQVLDRALEALGIEHLVLMIDEWTSLPVGLQPFIAEFLKRTVLPNRRITLKIASLEYRSRFSMPAPGGNVVGFELGPDVTANLDLDDYYVYERNPAQVEDIFQSLLFSHVSATLDQGMLEEHGIQDAASLRSRLFTEKGTFVELVRAGEGVVRDFLGIFAGAFFKAKTTGRQKIDLHSVEEAARDWYETDKSTALSDDQRIALHRIITDVIGHKQTKMFMLSREHANHRMIQSLFDLRMLHLIFRGYSDKENPGQRYNIYAVDYGTYVDLKRTRAEPSAFEITKEGVEDRERIVPFADRRSIRRVILHPRIFDDLASPE